MPHRILLVDDDPSIRRAVCRYLTRSGFAVDEADTGQQGLQSLRTASYDAVVTDLRMPGMPGEAFVEAVCEAHPHLAERIVLTSGDMSGESVRRLRSRVGCAALEKPFSMATLSGLLGRLLGTPQPSPAPSPLQ